MAARTRFVIEGRIIAVEITHPGVAFNSARLEVANCDSVGIASR
jgi:hypothetical protein